MNRDPSRFVCLHTQEGVETCRPSHRNKFQRACRLAPQATSKSGHPSWVADAGFVVAVMQTVTEGSMLDPYLLQVYILYRTSSLHCQTLIFFLFCNLAPQPSLNMSCP